MTDSRLIKFHHNGKTYFWNKASKDITNKNGLLIARNCPNLDAARIWVKHR